MSVDASFFSGPNDSALKGSFIPANSFIYPRKISNKSIVGVLDLTVPTAATLTFSTLAIDADDDLNAGLVEFKLDDGKGYFFDIIDSAAVAKSITFDATSSFFGDDASANLTDGNSYICNIMLQERMIGETDIEIKFNTNKTYQTIVTRQPEVVWSRFQTASDPKLTTVVKSSSKTLEDVLYAFETIGSTNFSKSDPSAALGDWFIRVGDIVTTGGDTINWYFTDTQFLDVSEMPLSTNSDGTLNYSLEIAVNLDNILESNIIRKRVAA